MTQFASDSFTGSSGTSLSTYNSAFTKVGSDSASSLSNANRVKGGAGGSRYEHSATPTGADYSVNVDVYVASTGDAGAAGPLGRCLTSGPTFYLARTAQGAGYQLYKCITGSYTQLGSTAAKTFAAGNSYNVKLDMAGTAIKLYAEGSGTASVSATDSAISAANKAGLYIYSNSTPSNSVGHHLDNWSADEASGTTVTETVAGRLKARGAASTVAIHAETVAGRRKARGAAATNAIHTEAAAGRRRARAADATLPTRTETVAGRVKAKAANTVVHTDAGSTTRTVAGKLRARGAATTVSIRNTTVVGKVRAKGADTVTVTRLSLAAGRLRTRAAVTAAPVVAGMITEAAAGRLRARGAVATTALRLAAIAGRVKARGADAATSIRTATAAGRARARSAVAGAPYVAPTLPLTIPPSSRTLSPGARRIGAATVDSDAARLGSAIVTGHKPRLG